MRSIINVCLVSTVCGPCLISRSERAVGTGCGGGGTPYPPRNRLTVFKCCSNGVRGRVCYEYCNNGYTLLWQRYCTTPREHVHRTQSRFSGQTQSLRRRKRSSGARLIAWLTCRSNINRDFLNFSSISVQHG